MTGAPPEEPETEIVAEPEATATAGRWLQGLARMERHYFAVDGGGGALVLSLLPALADQWRQVHTPRHADLLVVTEPVTTRFLNAVAETDRDVPRPRAVVLVQTARDGVDRRAPYVADPTAIFPGAVRVPSVPSQVGLIAYARAIVRTAQHAAWWDVEASSPAELPPERLVTVRPKTEGEFATEELIVSVGPVQEVTAGPLRVLLICDGEQVVRAELDGGYAARGLSALFPGATWAEGLAIAEQIDPLAPIVGRLAYAQAVEQLAGLEVPSEVQQGRLAALALERALNDLGWLARFASVMAYDWLARTARQHLLALAPHVPAPNAIGVGGWTSDGSSSSHDRQAALRSLAVAVRRLADHLASDRLPDARTKGIGVLPSETARAAGVTGPNLFAAEHGAGDARARLVVRVRRAAVELAELAGSAAFRAPVPRAGSAAMTDVARGNAVRRGEMTAEIQGPRGTLLLTVRSDGGDRPASVTWSGPSAAALRVLPSLLRGAKLADALAIIASLDLAMAEAEG